MAIKQRKIKRRRKFRSCRSQRIVFTVAIHVSAAIFEAGEIYPPGMLDYLNVCMGVAFSCNKCVVGLVRFCHY